MHAAVDFIGCLSILALVGWTVMGVSRSLNRDRA